MHRALVICGGLIAVFGFAGWAATLAQSAIQQTVQELRFIGAALGVIIVGIGLILGRLQPEKGTQEKLTNPDHIFSGWDELGAERKPAPSRQKKPGPWNSDPPPS